jgi:hypothetical protein
MNTQEKFIVSDYCGDCDGEGYFTRATQLFDDVQYENFQCETCEELHQQEIRADRLHDEMKEGV